MNAVPEFTDDILTFGVTGEGAVLDPVTGVITIRTGGMTYTVTGQGAVRDPATGLFTISADALSAGVPVLVAATDAGGVPAGGFRMVIAAAPAVIAPFMTDTPELLGTALIGAEVTLDPGVWDGSPVPTFSFQWRRDGVDIPGAAAAAYVPGPADDRTALCCAVTARNTAGSLIAVTAPRHVTYPAPVTTGRLNDLALRLGSGAATVDAAAGFVGAGLVFTVAGAGAVIDAASGLVRLPLDTPRANETVTVSATNSGGVVSSGFTVSVAAAAPVAPVPSGTIPEVIYAQDSGDQVVSTQAAFIGQDLIYTLEAAPAGITIQAGSGLVSISTAAPIARATVTVRASNAGGLARQSFAVTVRSSVSVFDAAGKLGDLGFVFDGAAPGWSLDTTGSGKLIPATTGRAHGLWSKAAGDGRYRCLARWAATETTGPDYAPFVLGARVARSGGNFTGVYVEAFRPASGTKRLRLQQYTGKGAETTLLASVTRTWAWTIWYWVDLEIDGPVVKARLYPEAGPVPDWQIEASTTATGAGGFGPGGAPLLGASPTILIKRLEFYPLGA